MTVLALTGGVGGAKLALGLARVLTPDEVVFVVNTGDDFEHFGLPICPDLDTLVYTLAGLASDSAGWGREDETWRFMETLERLGGETWFRVGDRDLALHVRRRALLAAGLGLTAATAALASSLNVQHPVLPMTDDPVRTRVLTPEGPLAFQHYFVRDRCRPTALGFEFAGAAKARLNPRIPFADLTAVVICPSNPFVSVDPILAVPGMTDALQAANVPVVAVTPIVGGKAIKGPTAKMMRELAIPTTAEAVARHYREFIDGFILDEEDAAAEPAVAHLGIATHVAQTVMRTLEDRVALAHTALDFAAALRLSRGRAGASTGP